MASRLGMLIRNEKAQARVDSALAALVAAAGITVPDAPVRTRDADQSLTLRTEWEADVLEVLVNPQVEEATALIDHKSKKAPSREL